VNGRKITFISYDDGYSPPKTVEMTRKLVESDQVLFIAGSVGTPTNTAIWQYMNEQKVPQLFPGTGATKWDDPKVGFASADVKKSLLRYRANLGRTRPRW
jgi:ABC-type branched-subunit amino acid transport system substrate-binding protein